MFHSGLLYKETDTSKMIYKITPYGTLTSQCNCLSSPIEQFDCRIINPHLLSFLKNTAILIMKELNTRITLIPPILSIIHDIFIQHEKVSLLFIEQLCDKYIVRLATLHTLLVKICYVSDFMYTIHSNTKTLPIFYINLMKYINTHYFDIHALL
jgi:hypothetical protein